MHFIGSTLLSLLFASAYAAPRASNICMCGTNGSVNSKLTRSCCNSASKTMIFGTNALLTHRNDPFRAVLR
ncbi:hypothetical protein C8R47DRAFT_33009 [Mycena vitilis]|nr:hypothetical protein C8R47DRAFT_33009 [Mycena vitilis]